MSTPNNSNLENLIQDKVKDHEFKYDNESWNKMQQKLQNAEKPFSGFRIGKGLKIFSLASVLVLLSFYAGYRFSHSAKVDTASADFSKKSALVHSNILPGGNNEPGTKIYGKPLAALSTKNSEMASISYDTKSLNKAKSNSKPGGELIKLIKTTEEKNNEFAKKHINNNLNNNTLLSKQELLLDNNNYQIEKKADEVQTTDKVILSADSLSKKAENTIETKISAHNTQGANSAPKPENESEKGPISFGLWGGYNYYLTLYKDGGDMSTLLITGGAFVNIPLSEKFGIQTGLAYGMMENFNAIKTDTVNIISDARGPLKRVTYTSLGGMNFLQVPVMLKYKINNRFRAMAGVQFSYGLQQGELKLVHDYQKDSLKQIDPLFDPMQPQQGGIRSAADIERDMNRLSVEIPVGIQVHIWRGWDFSALYCIGLTKLLKTEDHFISIQGPTNTAMQFKLSYKLFNKKFYEK